MLRLMKWTLLYGCLVSMCFAQSIRQDPMFFFNKLQENGCIIQLNGQHIDLYIPAKVVFYEHSTTVKNKAFARFVGSFIQQYQPHQVSVVGMSDNRATDVQRAILRTQTGHLLELMQIRRPGIIIMTQNETFVRNTNLEFWKNMTADSLIRISWKSEIPLRTGLVNET